MSDNITFSQADLEKALRSIGVTMHSDMDLHGLTEIRFVNNRGDDCQKCIANPIAYFNENDK